MKTAKFKMISFDGGNGWKEGKVVTARLTGNSPFGGNPTVIYKGQGFWSRNEDGVYEDLSEGTVLLIKCKRRKERHALRGVLITLEAPEGKA